MFGELSTASSLFGGRFESNGGKAVAQDFEYSSNGNAWQLDSAELQAFLEQRVTEMGDDSNVVSSGQFNTAPPGVQADLGAVQTMLGVVTTVVQRLTSKKMQDLFLIRSSPR